MGKIKTQKCFLIIAQAGVGKSTLADRYPDLIADVDCFLMRRLAGSPPPPAPLVRDPDFPINYVRALVRAFGTKRIVLSPIKGNWAIEPAIDLIPLVARPDVDNVREYVRYMLEMSPPGTKVSDSEVEKMTTEMLPLLEQLREIGFETVLLIPDKDCAELIVENIEARDKVARASGTCLGQEFRGRERELSAVQEVASMLENRYKSGLYKRLPLLKGQYFSDAFEPWLGEQAHDGD